MLTFSFLALLLVTADGFYITKPNSYVVPRIASKVKAKLHVPASSRRNFLTIGPASAAVAILSLAPVPSTAATVIDIASYGDKELKIATINKIKQLLRNELLRNPTQAPDWIKLAISDALSYNQNTNEGGPDGTVQFDVDKMKWGSGSATVRILRTIQKDVKRTNEVSLADVIAYAGAEAIEASGGPRIQVQVGRYDGKGISADAAPHLDWGTKISSQALTAAFLSAGLSVRDKTLLIGATANAKKAADSRTVKGAVVNIDEDDADSLFPENGGEFIPNTFGSQKQMFGDLLSSIPFDESVFRAAAAKDATMNDEFKEWLAGDDASKAVAQKYGSGKREVFFKDLADAYIRLTSAGASITGAKVLAP